MRYFPKYLLFVLLALNLVVFVQSLRAEVPKVPEIKAQQKIEPQAIALLKKMSERLAAARSMSFTATVSYESPSRIGPPLVYTTLSEVTLQRPNQLRVITLGDGPSTEFYYDGNAIAAYAPGENLVAVAEAPKTLDAALKFADDNAAIYFPFTDVIVSNPYKDMTEGLKTAFVVGQSKVVGGIKTDIVVVVNDQVFAQIWISVDDKLPRMIRAVYRNDPSRLRHQITFDNWKLDMPIPTDTFTSTKAKQASPIPFARPEPKSDKKAPIKPQ